MRLPDDDELYRVDAVYLGPPGRNLGTFRYGVIASWLAIGPLLFILMRRAGIDLNLLTVGLLLLITTRLSMLIADRISPERPVTALFSTFTNEMRTPRPGRKPSASNADGLTTRVTPPGRGLRRWVERQRQQATTPSPTPDLEYGPHPGPDGGDAAAVPTHDETTPDDTHAAEDAPALPPLLATPLPQEDDPR